MMTTWDDVAVAQDKTDAAIRARDELLAGHAPLRDAIRRERDWLFRQREIAMQMVMLSPFLTLGILVLAVLLAA